jgi:endoglucanase
MEKHLRITFSVLGVAAFIFAVGCAVQSHEPVYPGKRLSPGLGQSAEVATRMRRQWELRDGGIYRASKDQQKIALVFTGHEYAEGGPTILGELARHQAKASFFLTGDFLVNTHFAPLIRRIVKEGHYLGPHSDKHVLYCSWDAGRETLVTPREFAQDLQANVEKITRYQVAGSRIRYFLPAYENYNRQIVEWTAQENLTLINFTPGTRSNADYTGEMDKNFVSSQAILDSIVQRERDDPHGLNGFILLLHLGSGPGRADKFHTRFGELLDYLAGKGYQFVRVDELLEPKPTP